MTVHDNLDFPCPCRESDSIGGFHGMLAGVRQWDDAAIDVEEDLDDR